MFAIAGGRTEQRAFARTYVEDPRQVLKRPTSSAKQNDSELFEDVTLTVKNIGLALRTVAGDDSLRNAWTKDGNLVTFVNGQLKPIGQEKSQ